MRDGCGNPPFLCRLTNLLCQKNDDPFGPSSLQEPIGVLERVEWDIRRDRHQPGNRHRPIGRQGCNEPSSQIVDLALLIGHDAVNVLVDEALPGERAVEADPIHGAVAVADGVEQCSPRHRQEAFHFDVADRPGVEQNRQQRIGGEGGKAVGPEQGPARQHVRPCGDGAC